LDNHCAAGCYVGNAEFVKRKELIMPSKSEAQRRKMGQLHKEGKITDAQWDDFKKVVPKKVKKKGK
jgi:hypothetical protein